MLWHCSISLHLIEIRANRSAGPPLAPLLLRLVVGSRWTISGAGEVLGVYCYYIPFLAINGVSEAFVAATASTTELHQQSFWMTGFSVLFAASAYVFLRVLELGAKGCVSPASSTTFYVSYALQVSFSQLCEYGIENYF